MSPAVPARAALLLVLLLVAPACQDVCRLTSPCINDGPPSPMDVTACETARAANPGCGRQFEALRQCTNDAIVCNMNGRINDAASVTNAGLRCGQATEDYLSCSRTDGGS
jgi:hypothetical protein